MITSRERQMFDALWERISERLSDVTYELLGPESYDRDYKKQLRDDGLWEEEIAMWTPPGDTETIKLQAQYDLLWDLLGDAKRVEGIQKERNARAEAEFNAKYNRRYY